MKHLVLIAGIYYPEPSPTGKCAKQYIKLLCDDYDVDVIFIRSKPSRVFDLKVDGQRLFGLADWRLQLELHCEELRLRTTNHFTRHLAETGVRCAKAIGRLQGLVFFPGNLRWFQRKALRTLEAIHHENPIDVVFTVNSPFPAHLAGEAFKSKHPEVRWLTYTVDSFYAGNKKGGVDSRRAKQALRAEQRVLTHADANFLSEEVYQHGAEVYVGSKEKSFPLPYLLPDPCRERFEGFDSEKINLVFAGRFYQDIRNPEFLFRTFLMTSDPQLVLHLYVASNCDGLIDEYVRKSQGRIVRHSLVSVREIQGIMNGADILVNVGNSLPEFKPSKTFEYLATGLPVLNFYQNGLKDDVLAQYPLAAQISFEVDPDEAAVEIAAFCSSIKGKRMEYQEVSRIFVTHSSKAIRDTLLQQMKRT